MGRRGVRRRDERQRAKLLVRVQTIRTGNWRQRDGEGEGETPGAADEDKGR